MQDYQKLIQLVKEKHHAQEAPVITFGGSYGGMLATWMRLKYPQDVTAAVNSGGAILYFKNSQDVF
jgi:lysosomal Pro-X carboxypeptidase